MVVQLGINGFGRIGRMVLRATIEKPRGAVVVGINDPFLTPEYMAYQLKYDSVHGRFPGTVNFNKDFLIVNHRPIRVFHEKNPGDIDWATAGAEYVCECSGAFNSNSKASAHLKGGAAKVVLSAPAKDDVTPVMVLGVNHTDYRRDMTVVSAASCTTNALAPLVKVVRDSFGVEEGLMTTVHSVTANQLIVDGPAKGGKDWRMGRAASLNIIPSTTGAAKALGAVLPELKGKLTGMAFRVPTVDVSAIDVTVRLKQPASLADIQQAISEASTTTMEGILGWTDECVVSSDFIHDDRSAIYDARASVAISPHFVKLVAWYDNEWGYAMRMVELCVYMGTQDYPNNPPKAHLEEAYDGDVEPPIEAPP